MIWKKSRHYQFDWACVPGIKEAGNYWHLNTSK